MSSNGTYIIEDVYYKDQKKFINYFKDLDYNFSIIDIYHEENIANNCVIIVKKKKTTKLCEKLLLFQENHIHL